MSDTGLSLCRVVLVRTQSAGNVGAVARLMRNLGLEDLALVAPECDPFSHEARQFARYGEGLIDRARVVAGLGEAVADCVLVAGTSARTGGPVRRQNVAAPEAVAEALVEALPSGRVAVVFGPERTGLTDDEVTRCHRLLSIPTAEEYPALNLAQAAAVALYELRRAWLRCGDVPVSPPEPAAPFADQERAYADLRDALEAIGYLRGEKGPALFHAVRHLLGRARPTPMELRLLHGLAQQVRWFVRQHGSNHPQHPETLP
jgi:TrmH family RNA methyltransferase